MDVDQYIEFESRRQSATPEETAGMRKAAWAWIQIHDPERKDFYTPFRLTVNSNLEHNVPTTCPERRYANQR